MLERIFGGDDSGSKVAAEMAKNRALLDQIEVPTLNWQDYAPESLGTESANYEQVSEDPLIRSAQMSALSKMAGLADRGLSEEDAAGFQKARAQGAQMSRAGTEAALANAQARGVGGSGLEFAMREMANQQGAERASSAGLDQAANAARQRAMYNQAYAQQLSGVRGQDANMNQANADIINRFNMQNTQNRNNVNQQNVQNRNQAQQMNNQGRLDMSQRNFDNRMAKATGQMNVNKDMANVYANQGAANQADRNMMINLGAQAGMGAMGWLKKG